MSSKFLSLLLLSFVFGCKDDEMDINFQSDCYPAHLSNGVIASYSFSHGSLQDEASFSADLINTNGATKATDRNGNLDCAYYFNQSFGEQFLSTPKSFFLNNRNQFSISLWYQPMDSTRKGGEYEVLVGRNSISGQARCPDRRGEWSLGLYDCRRAVFGHNNSVWSIRPDFQTISCDEYAWSVTGVWKHLVAVYNSNNTYTIYENGVLQESQSGLGGCTNLHIAQDIGDLFIGRYFTGKIDDILIYDREISAAEVAELFALQACCNP